MFRVLTWLRAADPTLDGRSTPPLYGIGSSGRVFTCPIGVLWRVVAFLARLFCRSFDVCVDCRGLAATAVWGCLPSVNVFDPPLLSNTELAAACLSRGPPWTSGGGYAFSSLAGAI